MAAFNTGRKLKRRLSIVLCALLAGGVGARPVSPGDADWAATAWLATASIPGGDRIRNACSEDVLTYVDESGVPLLHVVVLEGGGYVVTSADTSLFPIVLYASGGDPPDEDFRNPFWTFVASGLKYRKELRDVAPSDPSGPGDGMERTVEPEEAWSALLAYAPTRAAALVPGRTDVADVRVPPLLGSQWGQEDVGGLPVFNSQTPYNLPCGCVATALAQIMRHHRFPATPVPSQSFLCLVEGTAAKIETKGGTYLWNDMPLVPDETISARSRLEIGKLCHDIAVAARSAFALSGTSTSLERALPSLLEYFGYSNASYLDDYDTAAGLPQATLRKIIPPNLDAGLLVCLSVSLFEDGYREYGHAIVADGYGYVASSLYVHLNMGWQGKDDIWYRLPDIPAQAKGYDFSAVSAILYNVMPQSRGGVLSGRVLDADGAPVAQATVTATGPTGARTAKTDARGIYSFVLPLADSCKLVAAKNGVASVAVTRRFDAAGDVPDVCGGADLRLGARPVAFNARGGTSATASRYYVSGAAYGWLPRAKRTGHAFLGWYTKSSGGRKVTASSQASASVKTLYARWRRKSYRVVFEANGGRIGERKREVRTVKYNAALGTLAKPRRKNFAFLGWYTGQKGGTKVSRRTKVKKSMRLYAHWTSAKKKAVFDANGGRIGRARTTTRLVKYGTKIGKLPTPTRRNFVFRGWYTAKSGGLKISRNTRLKKSARLYAHWAKPRED